MKIEKETTTKVTMSIDEVRMVLESYMHEMGYVDASPVDFEFGWFTDYDGEDHVPVALEISITKHVSEEEK